MVRIQNVCRKAILKRFIPILVGFIYGDIICSKTPFKGLALKKEVEEVLILYKINMWPPLPRMCFT